MGGKAQEEKDMEAMAKSMEIHLREKLIPFWQNLRDETYGGYTGYVGYDLKPDKTYEKGCILNSRILWFFSNACKLTGDKALMKDGDRAFQFLKNHCLDREYGGVFWSVTCDGRPLDTTKHTYNQAFALYALSSYYEASGSEEALALAAKLQRIIEEKCRDEGGYLEAFDREFQPVSNEKLSENGVMASRTMNTLLHVFEAYTEYYRVCRDERTADCLRFMLDLIDKKVYNRKLRRQEVFFDHAWNSLTDLHSYGHDIEAAWLIDRGLEILGDKAYTDRMRQITEELTECVYEKGYRDHALFNETEKGVDDRTRIWWVQAEAVTGFVNGFQKQKKEKYLAAAKDIWGFIRAFLADQREGSEWFWSVDEKGVPSRKPIVEPWKCPYHNGRMCMEVMKRAMR